MYKHTGTNGAENASPNESINAEKQHWLSLIKFQQEQYLQYLFNLTLETFHSFIEIQYTSLASQSLRNDTDISI